MGLDTWLEQDIRQFLDDEVKAAQQPQPARLEDAASIMSDHNWVHEINDQVKRRDVDSAKQLFAMLRMRYQQTPEAHNDERQKLYELLKESYVAIANVVLDKYRTDELLKRMESSPGDPFNMKIKPVNLSVEDAAAKPPSAIDFTPFTKDVVGASPLFKKLGDVAPETDAKDHLSFDPEALLRANQELAVRVQEAQQAAAVTDQTVRDLLAALKLAIHDPRGALAALDTMLQKPLAPDVRAAGNELRAAIVDREEMMGFNKQTTIELQRLGQLAAARDELLLPTAQRLREQLTEFAKAHPHYPPRHLEHLRKRIDTLAGPAPALAASNTVTTSSMAPVTGLGPDPAGLPAR